MCDGRDVAVGFVTTDLTALTLLEMAGVLGGVPGRSAGRDNY